MFCYTPFFSVIKKLFSSSRNSSNLSFGSLSHSKECENELILCASQLEKGKFLVKLSLILELRFAEYHETASCLLGHKLKVEKGSQ